MLREHKEHTAFCVIYQLHSNICLIFNSFSNFSNCCSISFRALKKPANAQAGKYFKKEKEIEQARQQIVLKESCKMIFEDNSEIKHEEFNNYLGNYP